MVNCRGLQFACYPFLYYFYFLSRQLIYFLELRFGINKSIRGTLFKGFKDRNALWVLFWFLKTVIWPVSFGSPSCSLDEILPSLPPFFLVFILFLSQVSIFGEVLCFSVDFWIYIIIIIIEKMQELLFGPNKGFLFASFALSFMTSFVLSVVCQQASNWAREFAPFLYPNKNG